MEIPTDEGHEDVSSDVVHHTTHSIFPVSLIRTKFKFTQLYDYDFLDGDGMCSWNAQSCKLYLKHIKFKMRHYYTTWKLLLFVVLFQAGHGWFHQHYIFETRNHWHNFAVRGAKNQCLTCAGIMFVIDFYSPSNQWYETIKYEVGRRYMFFLQAFLNCQYSNSSVNFAGNSSAIAMKAMICAAKAILLNVSWVKIRCRWFVSLNPMFLCLQRDARPSFKQEWLSSKFKCPPT